LINRIFFGVNKFKDIFVGHLMNRYTSLIIENK